MSGVDTPRDSAGRFLAKESKSDSGGIDGSSPAVLAKFEDGLTTDEYQEAKRPWRRLPPLRLLKTRERPKRLLFAFKGPTTIP